MSITVTMSSYNPTFKTTRHGNVTPTLYLLLAKFIMVNLMASYIFLMIVKHGELCTVLTAQGFVAIEYIILVLLRFESA